MFIGTRRVLARSAARAARRIGGDVGEVGDLGGAWSIPADCDPATAEIIRKVQAYTLTPPVRIMALCEAVRYLERAGIEGDVVECGVWRGGSMMAAALALLELCRTERRIHLFDTFDEMPPPGELDAHASGLDLHRLHAEGRPDPVYKIHPVKRVREVVEGTGYPRERLHFVAGMVEEKIPEHAPETIALCRLDTDWYESTAHEMKHLLPRIPPGGVLILDDYGDFLGARKAVDEVLASDGRPVLMHRVDETCRTIVLPEA